MVKTYRLDIQKEMLNALLVNLFYIGNQNTHLSSNNLCHNYPPTQYYGIEFLVSKILRRQKLHRVGTRFLS
jgi:hypothetical protein